MKRKLLFPVWFRAGIITVIQCCSTDNETPSKGIQFHLKLFFPVLASRPHAFDENETFWKHSPEWRFFKASFSWIHMDSRKRNFLRTTTLSMIQTKIISWVSRKLQPIRKGGFPTWFIRQGSHVGSGWVVPRPRRVNCYGVRREEGPTNFLRFGADKSSSTKNRPVCGGRPPTSFNFCLTFVRLLNYF